MAGDLCSKWKSARHRNTGILLAHESNYLYLLIQLGRDSKISCNALAPAPCTGRLTTNAAPIRGHISRVPLTVAGRMPTLGAARSGGPKTVGWGGGLQKGALKSESAYSACAGAGFRPLLSSTNRLSNKNSPCTTATTVLY
eukprot:1178402-Prorocentrum_minimum.AAC.6